MDKALSATRTPYTAEELATCDCGGGMQGRSDSGCEGVPHVEQIQDIVEKELMARGWFDAAKAILYTGKSANANDLKKNKLLEKIDAQDLFAVEAVRCKKKNSMQRKCVARWCRRRTGMKMRSISMRLRIAVQRRPVRHDHHERHPQSNGDDRAFIH